MKVFCSKKACIFGAQFKKSIYHPKIELK